ncbi:MAG: glycine zipper family protein [Nitrospirota bacterium]
MAKKIIVLTVLISFLVSQAAAFGAETKGEIVFKDAMYGAGIGALLGMAFYLIEEKDFGKKLGAGVVAGTIGGLLFGIIEANSESLVEIEENRIKIAMPTPIIQKRDNGFSYSVSLLKVNFSE